MDARWVKERVNLHEFLPYEQWASPPDGRKGKILCPFHEERNASCIVYEDGFKCFACGEYGDQIDLVMKLYGCNFKDAIKRLANGVSGGARKLVVRTEPEDRSIPEDKESAILFTQSHLVKSMSHPLALQWYKRRGWNTVQAREQELGWIERPFPTPSLLSSLSVADYRATIPIRNREEQIVGWMLRRTSPVLDSRTPKYLKKCIPHAPLFFNIHNAYYSPTLFVVEGQYDALKAQANGFTNFVAMGTAVVGRAQLKHALSEDYNRIVWIPDNDRAGLEGAERNNELAKSMGLLSEIVRIPIRAADDVDELLNQPDGMSVMRRMLDGI